MHEIGIQTDSLEQIMAGKKTIEGRLATQRFLSIQVGDTISIREDIWRGGRIIDSRAKTATILITHIHRFPTFRDMLKLLGFEKFRPDVQTLPQAIEMFTRYYSRDDELRLGVVGLEFKLK